MEKTLRSVTAARYGARRCSGLSTNATRLRGGRDGQDEGGDGGAAQVQQAALGSKKQLLSQHGTKTSL